jgi:uncharacterized protein (DUF58 family)
MKFISGIKEVFLAPRFFQILSGIITLYVFGYFFPVIEVVAQLLLYSFIALAAVDLFFLYSGALSGSRQVPDRLSNGDLNPVNYTLFNTYKTPIKYWCIDEFPVQWQIRDAIKTDWLKPGECQEINFQVRPVERGWYAFGRLRLMVATPLGIFKRRFTPQENMRVKVYPSFLQLKKTELYAFSPIRNQQVTKKIQHPGNSREFEHIKDYVAGDDYRRLNWKATARLNKLMVNEYQEERSRNIYQLIDMGRTMKSPFNGMTLLDYAINSSLALSNVILKKQDNPGLVTYSSGVHSLVKAKSRNSHLNTMLETLFAQETNFEESNLEQVYAVLQKNTEGRSLLIFYTNFESIAGLQRQLPILKKLAALHLVLLVTFIDTDLEAITENKATNTKEIYFKTLAEEHLEQKVQLLQTLAQYGIIHIKVRPGELSLAVIDKYLEVKENGIL